jgi:hypothetical protein
VDVELINDGEVSEVPDVFVTVEWEEGRLMAYDVLNGFSELHTIPELTGRVEVRREMMLQGPSGSMGGKIAPGERWLVAWLRFEGETEVHVSVSRNQQ